eukprot:CAMPEP_0179486834 /NCGR_PEP_ID=MMETSP0799-20121207/62993_1 /TAXON_ID=46947 /ORGANISM="Geminigera cryophila, Strain CCMP2564" /LENGTH=31 /DNA_ID= /DNA_START= /DNA_END= /DNA_ORIENTATION=
MPAEAPSIRSNLADANPKRKVKQSSARISSS